MRIGLDLDGLLDERPDFFAFLTAALRGQGHFVAVLTYRNPESRPQPRVAHAAAPCVVAASRPAWAVRLLPPLAEGL